MTRIHVVAGIIVAQDSRILIARRPAHLHQGGLWEFPGGKCESGEAPTTALARELKEELGIRVLGCCLYQSISHDYPDKEVLLDFWWVDEFAGEPVGLEGQEVRWVERAQLGRYEFPAANAAIVELLASS